MKKCLKLGNSLFERGERRAHFIFRYWKSVQHSMSHFKGEYSFYAPIWNCQINLVEKFREAIPYSPTTAFRDILYRIWRDYEAIKKSSVKGQCKPVCLTGLYRKL